MSSCKFWSKSAIKKKLSVVVRRHDSSTQKSKNGNRNPPQNPETAWSWLLSPPFPLIGFLHYCPLRPFLQPLSTRGAMVARKTSNLEAAGSSPAGCNSNSEAYVLIWKVDVLVAWCCGFPRGKRLEGAVRRDINTAILAALKSSF